MSIQGLLVKSNIEAVVYGTGVISSAVSGTARSENLAEYGHF